MLKILFFVLVTALPAIPLGSADADTPGRHPAYLHALTETRQARWLLERRAGDVAVSVHLAAAIGSIDEAVHELTRAAYRDGKDFAETPPPEIGNFNHPGRLHKAAELLRQARSNVAREEDNPEDQHLQHRALEHLDEALRQTDAAIWDVEHFR